MLQIAEFGAVEFAENGHTILAAWRFTRTKHGRWLASRGTVTEFGISGLGGETVDITDVVNFPDARPGGRPNLIERLRSLPAISRNEEK